MSQKNDEPIGAAAARKENFFYPRQHEPNRSMQRLGIRSARRLIVVSSAFVMLFMLFPTQIGSLYVKYVVEAEWIRRAEEMYKTIWSRRNEKVFEAFMTQRKNTIAEIIGLKRYDISSEENRGDIQKSK